MLINLCAETKKKTHFLRGTKSDSIILIVVVFVCFAKTVLSFVCMTPGTVLYITPGIAAV